jgi:hypothetical protein
LEPFVENNTDVLSTFSDPDMRNNIIWQNRKFYWTLEDPLPTIFGLCPDINAAVGLTCTGGLDNPDFGGNAPVYDDLAVLGTTGGEALNCSRCVLTGNAGVDGASAHPDFMYDYVNGARNTINLPEGTTSIGAAPAFDEGGNFIRVRFGPLTLTRANGDPFGDYHIQSGSTAENRARATNVRDDFDGEPRSPVNVNNVNDIGADEIQPY